jgi:hypothetical protein
MYLFMLLPLAFPFACLALLSTIAFLGVVALGGALYVIGTAKSLLRIAAQKIMTRGPVRSEMLTRSTMLRRVASGRPHEPTDRNRR